MLPKKYPKADISRNSKTYFVAGLAFALFLVWVALEIKKPISKDRVTYNKINIEEFIQEDIPITKELKTPPPKLSTTIPEVIEVVEDKSDVEESIIKSTETDQDDVIEDVVKIEDVEVEEEEIEETSVPFAVIEEVPIFPGCEAVSKENKRACFQEFIEKHVKKHFKYPSIAQDLDIQGKVYVLFVIDANGFVTGIKSRGPDKLLEKEAERIIGLLPKMVPGKQRGRAVNVPYSIPITFKLQN